MHAFLFFQLLNHVWLFATPWTAASQASLSITNSQSLLILMPIELVMPSNHLILCHPLLFPPSIFPSIRVFSNEWALHIRWTKYWNCSFKISPANEHSELISFRMDWLDLLAVQGTLKSLLQHHSSKASIHTSCLNCQPLLRSNKALPWKNVDLVLNVFPIFQEKLGFHLKFSDVIKIWNLLRTMVSNIKCILESGVFNCRENMLNQTLVKTLHRLDPSWRSGR